MPVNDELGKRMKEKYEMVPRTRLVRRVPVAIRIDGKAFHTFTKNFHRPFDLVLMEAMQNTMKYLCQNIQGCVFGYTQSDEITLILIDYQKLTSDAWFDYQVQKMCSVAASMATMAFGKFFQEAIQKHDQKYDISPMMYFNDPFDYMVTLHNAYWKAYEKGAMFDARVFNIPKEEVANLIYWRQLDASRNSIQMVGQAYFPHKELQNLTCNMIQEKLFQEKGINWNDFPTDQKRGACCVKRTVQDERFDIKDGAYPVKRWVIDKDIPIFVGEEGRRYIEDLIYVGEEE